MVCPKCGTRNPDDFFKCIRCGAELINGAALRKAGNKRGRPQRSRSGGGTKPRQAVKPQSGVPYRKQSPARAAAVRKKQSGADAAIIAVMIVLAIAFCTVIGLAVHDHIGGGRKGYSVGAGGGSVMTSATEQPGNGSVSGSVEDAVTGEPLGEAAVTASDAGSPVSSGSVFSDGAGMFVLSLPPDTYRLSVTATGYRPCRIYDVGVTSGETTYLQNAILLTEIGGEPLSRAGGRIINALDGEAVADAAVRFRTEWGNKDGEYVRNAGGNIIEVYSGEDGSYFTSDLKYGYYTAEIEKDGYSTQYVNLVATPDSDVSITQDIVMSPKMADSSDMRITLEWGSEPRDEDAHIIGALPGGDSFHVYFANMEAAADGKTVATLDHDDLQGNGFETVTLNVDPEGSYKYYVHRFAGEGSLMDSNAIVKVYRGGVLVRQYNVPTDQGGGDYWHVFDIEGGELVTVNRMTDTEPQHDR